MKGNYDKGCRNIITIKNLYGDITTATIPITTTTTIVIRIISVIM